MLENGKRDGDTLCWYHYSPDRKESFREGWCHGPSGTGRLFLYLAALLFGISLGNHPLIALFLPAVCYLVIAERGLRFLLGRRLFFALGLILLGLSVYLYVPLRAAHNPPPGLGMAEIIYRGGKGDFLEGGVSVPASPGGRA